MPAKRVNSRKNASKLAAPQTNSACPPESEHPIIGMTQTMVLRTTTALGRISSLVQGCCEKISQALVFARMAREMATFTRICQAPLQQAASLFGAAQPATRSSAVAASAAMGAFPFWQAPAALPALAGPAQVPSLFAPWLAAPAGMEAAAFIAPAAAFITAVAEIQAQLPNVFAAFWGLA
jgi:hypothetical protein